MKHNLMVPLVSYNGAPFHAQSSPQSDGVAGAGPMTLKAVLENACVSANPQEYPTGDQKMQIYQLLLKLHAAAPFAELSAEDVTLLKRLVGTQMTVAAVGAVFTLLENPVQEHIRMMVEGGGPPHERPQ